MRVCFTCLIIRLVTYQAFYWEPIFEHALFQTSADNWDRRCAANFLRTALAPTTTLLKIQFGGEDQRRLRKCLCRVATLLPRRPYPRLYLPRLLPLSSFPFLCAGDLFGVDLCFNCFIEGFAHSYWRDMYPPQENWTIWWGNTCPNCFKRFRQLCQPEDQGKRLLVGTFYCAKSSTAAWISLIC